MLDGQMPSDDKTQYCYSLDDEMFSGRYDTLEEALEEAFTEARDIREHDQLGQVFVGKICDYDQKWSYPDADDIIDCMKDKARGEVGEAEEGWLCPVPKEIEKELTDSIAAVIEQWLSKHKMEPYFYTVSDSTAYPVPEDSEDGE